jgi:hypothetical protein
LHAYPSHMPGRKLHLWATAAAANNKLELLLLERFRMLSVTTYSMKHTRIRH